LHCGLAAKQSYPSGFCGVNFNLREHASNFELNGVTQKPFGHRKEDKGKSPEAS